MSRLSFDATQASPPSPQRGTFMPISPERHGLSTTTTTTTTNDTSITPTKMTVLQRAEALKNTPTKFSLDGGTTIDTTPTTPRRQDTSSTTTRTTDPRKFSVTNLDTGESFRIDHVP